MQCSPFFGACDVIANVHSDGVTPISFDQGGRKSSVDKESAFVHSIRGNGASGDVEVVRGAPPCTEVQREPDIAGRDKTYRR